MILKIKNNTLYPLQINIKMNIFKYFIYILAIEIVIKYRSVIMTQLDLFVILYLGLPLRRIK